MAPSRGMARPTGTKAEDKISALARLGFMTAPPQRILIAKVLFQQIGCNAFSTAMSRPAIRNVRLKSTPAVRFGQIVLKNP